MTHLLKWLRSGPLRPLNFHPHIGCGNTNGIVSIEDDLVTSYKTKHTLIDLYLSNLLFTTYSKELKDEIIRKIFICMLIDTLFIPAKNGKQFKCPFSG